MIRVEAALATLRDYAERSTHWKEGGADRHSALLALKALGQEISRLKGVELELTAALGYVDEIVQHKSVEVSYETMQRSGFKRRDGWRRAFTLGDARRIAAIAAIRLRNAWQLLDPL